MDEGDYDENEEEAEEDDSFYASEDLKNDQPTRTKRRGDVSFGGGSDAC